MISFPCLGALHISAQPNKIENSYHNLNNHNHPFYVFNLYPQNDLFGPNPSTIEITTIEKTHPTLFRDKG